LLVTEPSTVSIMPLSCRRWVEIEISKEPVSGAIAESAFNTTRCEAGDELS
jgi:hypothetical protein